MFGLYHQEAARKKVKFILSLFSHKFFFNKSVLDIGAGNGEIGASLFKMGASVTALDANQEYLKAINKKFPQIKTVRQDLDLDTKINNKFDIIFHIATLNHLNKWEDHLNSVCKMTNDVLVLETSVCDSDDPEINFEVTEDVNLIGGSYNKIGNRTSANRIEKILRENGISYYRLDVPELNYQKNIYNWKVENTGRKDYFLRRFWICSKRTAIIEQLRKKYYKPIEKVSLDLDEVEVPLNKEDEVAETYHLAEPAPVLNNANLTSTIQPAKESKIIKIKEWAGSFENKKFVIVIPSYKNEHWAEKNILSALDQNYDNFRIIFTDDCSPDDTFKITENIVNAHKNKNKCTLIHNKDRKGALENLYDMIHSCDDEEIVITLDGDDWLAGNEVLNFLNKEYNECKIWMTYGRYITSPGDQLGTRKVPDDIVKSNKFRDYPFCTSHLRTFYSSLFKKIKKDDLMYEGKFMSMAWDVAMMIPMLEMAGERSKFLDKILYFYNMSNPISDFRVNERLQINLDHFVRTKPKYNRLKYLFNKSIKEYVQDNMIFVSVEEE